MLKNYLKIAIRNLLKHRVYSFINITGLAVGIACAFLILLWVQDELSYDSFHENANRIARVTIEYHYQGQGGEQLWTPSGIAPILRREFPEVERAVRFYRSSQESVIALAERKFVEKDFYFADSTVFDVFTLPFLAGRPPTALARPNTVVLTESTAKKYFGDQSPLGRMLVRNSNESYEVTGVIADIPHSSHLHFDFLASYTSLTASWARNEVWDTANFLTYLLLRDPGDLRGLEGELAGLVDREMGEQLKAQGATLRIQLRRLPTIHLHSHLRGEANGDIADVYAFAAIAFLILLIACANYMNLATARSARRAREVGVRKVLGAFGAQLGGQFFAESALMAFLALALAFLLLEITLPLFNYVAGKQLSLNFFGEPLLVLDLVGVGVFVALVAGFYPALFLSRFRPVAVLKGAPSGSSSLASFRNKLVVLQFVVSIILIVATLVVGEQLDYARQKNLGFRKEQVLVLPIADTALRQSYAALKNELLQHPDILHASAVDGYPGHLSAGYKAGPAEGLDEARYPLANGIAVDPEIVETLDIQLVAGEGFPKSYKPEMGYFYIINQHLLARLGWSAQAALGRWLDLQSNRRGKIVGVARDFHFESLHRQIEPLAMFLSPRPTDRAFLLVQLSTQDLAGTLAFIAQKWRQLAPHRPFEYKFLDQEFDALYQSDSRMGELFASFSALATVVSCLGLLGLAAYMAEHRTKEIGIRKVLGASVANIANLLSWDFLKLVLLANLFAWPVAWYAMNKWLQNFAYRIEISWWVFLLAGGLALVIALLTVSTQAIRAALTNPVESLQYE